MTEFKFGIDTLDKELTREEKIDILLDTSRNKINPKIKPMFLYVDGVLVIPMPNNKYLWFFDHGCHQYLNEAESKAILLSAEKIYQSGEVTHLF